jgi:16S rRNA A1518/A1519 N6-dimethyltransferase RsmA/KsgA/DIM1 with predicted DNA glycosylase/AP lyase activity
LGQHYLIETSVVDSMIDLADIKGDERVLEIGTGKGALTKRLVSLTNRLEGYEIDMANYEQLQRELGQSLSLHNRDVFKSQVGDFDVLLSSLPYSESSVFVEWLSRRRYDRAVVLVQWDFARKITAPPGSRAYRAVSVISQASAQVEIVSDVGRLSFEPPPRVDSCLVMMKWRRCLTSEEIAMIKRIFSQKRRTVKAALRSLGLVAPRSASSTSSRDGASPQCRVNSLRPESVLAMVGVLARAARLERGRKRGLGRDGQ